MRRPSREGTADAPTVAPGSQRADGPPFARALSAGDTIVERYRIVRFLALGAMGEVYEALDLELGGRVAVKTLRPEIAGDASALERFRREVALARRVTHPNICRIFDLQHDRTATPAGPLAVLTMELIEGETLAARLARGALTVEQAWPLVRQMAAALDAAHQAGVVHRDFKAGNVMLEAGEPERVVVTDFGLAHGPPGEPSGQAEPLTVPGLILGTPDYMAPEQIRGGVGTPASDLYAFGVVLYEMVAGRRPFGGSDPLAILSSRLAGERPRSPRAYAPVLPRSWELAILRCLEPDPARRFSSAHEAVIALEGKGMSARGRRVGAAAVVAALVAGLFSAWDAVRPDARTAPARPSVAIVGFDNLLRDTEVAWLSDALSELLATEVAAADRWRVVPVESVARAKRELGLADTDRLDAESLQRLRRNLGADVVVVGSYAAPAGPPRRIRVDLRVQRTPGGETVARISESASEPELLDMIARTGARLRSALGAPDLSADQARGLAAARPANPEAGRLYSSGLARLHAWEPQPARALLEEAVQSDPSFALAHAALAAAWEDLGDRTRALAASTRAFELSSALPRNERIAVEGAYWASLEQWGPAVDAYRRLVVLAPDDLDYGLRLAAAQTASGDPHRALETLEALRRLPAPQGQDPRIDLATGEAAAALSDFAGQRAAAERAAEEGRRRGASLLVARARLQEWWARRNTGDLPGAMAACAEARQLSAALGDRSGVALALNAEATIHADQGRLDEAEAADRKALQAFRELGDRRHEGWALNNLARLGRMRGDSASALRLYGESLSLARAVADRSAVARALANRGRLQLELGDLEGARRSHEESLALRRELGEKRGVAGAVVDLGLVLLREGRLAEAKRRCEEALAGFRDVGDRQSAAHVLAYLGETLLAAGEYETARRAHREALEIRAQMGLELDAAASRLALATVSFEEGELARAEAELAELLRRPGSPASGGTAALAQALLAELRLAQGRPSLARQAAQEALRLVEGRVNLESRIRVWAVAARVRATVTPLEASRSLEDLRRWARQAEAVGLIECALEVRLAAADVVRVAGQAKASLRERAAVAREAARHGFARVARKAGSSPADVRAAPRFAQSGT